MSTTPDPTSPLSAAPPSLVGTVLGGRYRIERLLGEGGMGTVYQAEHTLMHKRVAVKVLHAEMSRMSEVVARFEREAMAAAHMEHPNVAAATDFGKLDDGTFYLVLEFVEGKSLRDALAEGRFEVGRALHVARQIASALGRAHALGIVHRDLKPENVMLVMKDGEADFVKVLDFGIAKIPPGGIAGSEGQSSGPALTKLGMVYGTPEYMAPEQALGQQVDARADLYALGVIMFEMLTGVRPFEHESKVALLGMHVTSPVPRMRDRAPDANVPPAIEAAVARLLAKDSRERFDGARELVDALDAISAQPGPAALAPPPAAQGLRGAAASAVEAAAAWVVPRRRLVVASGVGAVVVLVVALLAARRGPVAAGAVHPGGWSPLPALRLPDPHTEQAVAAARAAVEKGDFAAAIEQLLPVEKESPRRPDVHMLLERAYSGTHAARDVVREAGEWLALEADAAGDARLQEDVRAAAAGRDAPDEAFGLLESKMGARGLDVLYDMAYGPAGRAYPQASARAKRSLAQEDVRVGASDKLAILLDFRDARTCDAKRALLDRARDQGDSRMATLLQQYQATRGCGFLGVWDCYPCLHKDKALSEAIGTIEERAAKGP